MPNLVRFPVSHQVSDRYTPKTRESNSATPILIRGAERRVAVRVDVNESEGRPQGLYGNAFSRASSEVVRRACVRVLPPTVSHLICIAALNGGFGRYTLAQITDLFTTAYTGYGDLYLAVLILAPQIHGRAARECAVQCRESGGAHGQLGHGRIRWQQGCVVLFIGAAILGNSLIPGSVDGDHSNGSR